MDFGCGRGGLVGQLRVAGADAYGVDIDERFIHSDRILSRMWEGDCPILSLMEVGGRTLFKDGFFDAVITDRPDLARRVMARCGLALPPAR